MSNFLTASHWLVSVPNDQGSSKAVIDRISSSIVEVAGRPLAEVYGQRLPNLKIGSLDTLMALSDDLIRIDAFVESVLRKVERQVIESYNALKLAQMQQAAKEKGVPVGPIPALEMRSAGKPVHTYMRDWAWDEAAWDSKEPLPELTKRMMAAAEKIDQDIRAVASAYQEKKTALVAAERKRSGNLMVVGLEDVITPKALQTAEAEWMPADSEFLCSQVVVIQKSQEEAFLESYSGVDGQAVPLGPEGRRDAVRGSPVVPGSARKIAEDKDGYCLYVLVVLKKFVDGFRAGCRDKRWTVRDFEYTPALAGTAAAAVAALTAEADKALTALMHTSRNRYEATVSLWLHVKAVRAVVEGTLRYGRALPVVAVVLKLSREEGQPGARKVLEALQAAWKFMAGAQGAFDAFYNPPVADEESGKPAASDPVIPGISEASASGAPSLPFVFLDFDVRPDSSATGK